LNKSSPILSTVDLQKRFGKIIAVDGISWEIEEGETIGVLGPNGAGKSTLFNIISGVLTPSSGKIYFDGDDITADKANEIAQKGLVKTFQTTNLFSDLTVAENIRIAAQVNERTYKMVKNGDSLTEVNETTSSIIQEFDLERIKETPMKELSYGDQRIVEIAVVLATNPKVILLDEPTSGVSQNHISKIFDILRSLRNDGEHTTLIIEHNIDFLLDISEYIIVLHQGQILTMDTPENITDDDQVQKVYLS